MIFCIILLYIGHFDLVNGFSPNPFVPHHVQVQVKPASECPALYPNGTEKRPYLICAMNTHKGACHVSIFQLYFKSISST